MLKRDFLTPPMGWNSYDNFDTSVTEAQVRANAACLAEKLKPYGWEYAVVDIQWYGWDTGSDRAHHQYLPFGRVEMDPWGRLLPCPQKFPSSAGGAGFRPLAEYIHSLGLKFGIHIMRGIPRQAVAENCTILGADFSCASAADPASICGWNPDMYGARPTPAGQAYYDSILRLYAEWGVDFIKCDDICNTNLYKNPFSGRGEMEMLCKAVENCGREMVLSLSPGPAILEQSWFYGTHANMWRITDDFWDSWILLKDMFLRCQQWQDHVAMGRYPDCDMLPLGHIGDGFGEPRETRFTLEEQKTMMTLWCLFHSPLMLGADLTRLDEDTLTLLTNPHVLALNREGRTPRQLVLEQDRAVWASVGSEDVTIALFNLGEAVSEVSVSLDWARRVLGVPIPAGRATELWTGEEIDVADSVSVRLSPHSCGVYRICVEENGG